MERDGHPSQTESSLLSSQQPFGNITTSKSPECPHANMRTHRKWKLWWCVQYWPESSWVRIQVESSCLLSGYGLSTRHLKRRQGAGAGTQSCHQCGKCSEFGSTWETSITNGNLYLCEFCVSGAFREHWKNTWRVVQPLCTSFAFVCKIVMPIP